METDFLAQGVKSGYGYHPDFSRKGIREQIDILSKIFNLNPEMALNYLGNGEAELPLPSGCHHQDGLFAVVSPFGFKKLLDYKEADVFNPTMYCKSLYFLFGVIAENMSFINYRNGVLSPQFFIQTEKSLEGYARLSYFQGESYIWLINAQLGFLHRGESANTELYPNEYGLSSVFAGSIKLTHPKFASDTWNYLGATCIGDKFVFDNSAPAYSSNDSCEFYTSHSIENPYPKFGGASLFL